MASNLLPFFKGDAKKSPRQGFLYWSDDGDLMAIRVRDWKITFMEQHTEVVPRLQPASGRASSRNCVRPCCTICAQIRSSAGRPASYYGDWFAHRVIPVRACAGHRREISGKLQRVSAARQGSELHRQRRDGQDHCGRLEGLKFKKTAVHGRMSAIGT